jgi:hypothetical protein
MKIFTRAGIGLLSMGIPLLAASAEEDMSAQAAAVPTTLVNEVRQATGRFRDINVAIAEGWVPATPCVSGPNSGAMGVHFLLPQRLHDGMLKADEPEALIYEPLSNGAMRLVGVEFIVIASEWKKHNPKAGPPAVEGVLTNLVTDPNRYGLPAFYELHVWAWEKNPDGNYADWNTLVSCERQPLDANRT